MTHRQHLLILFLSIALDFVLGFLNYSESKVYITGTASGLKPFLPAIIGNFYIIASLFNSYSIIIYCNRSDIEILQGSNWLKNDSNVHVIEEGKYGAGFEQKPARLAFGRNKILTAVNNDIRRHNVNIDTSFLVMVDLDEVIGNIINRTVLSEALDRNEEWDAVSFNRKRYYDIWALRYNKFSANVCSFGPDSGLLVRIIMNDISSLLQSHTQLFFPVYSAFNGIAV